MVRCVGTDRAGNYDESLVMEQGKSYTYHMIHEEVASYTIAS